eukprot:CAMPEP_0201709192 /NCGR_PEP_ID=MMETSP0578-20130828/57968_1 /ASSEMBLY_ACC=CAM_ASM_000663 /TAXON_ID=267565 /ORGANISM="Skeletonema grethea, Strain CCMP 1804" /LENGTH=287 /DNA_ID=CAMNT_0048198147 /DNA_START=50 /DNA_END=913 /DNA_ORIENTATION=+
MQPLESSLRRGSSQTSADVDHEALELPIGGDGRPNIPITRHLDDSGRTKDTAATEESELRQMAYTFESVEERPFRTVTWNIEKANKQEEEEEPEETLSMLGRRKLKAWKKQELARKKEQERKSWKTWFWSQGCPCMDWSPMHLFRSDEDRSTVAAYDQSTVATKSFDQSSMASSTIFTLDNDGDDNSTIPSFSRVGSTLDEQTIEDDDNISDVSSNSTDASLDWEIEDGLEMLAERQPPEPLQISQPFKPKLSATTIEASIVKDWSREGLSLNTIDDMDLYMEAMRS